MKFLILPTLLIALLALIALIIFVKKEKESKYKAIDIISVVFNFVISFLFIPIITILAVFIDIEGGGPDLFYQVMYFIPAFSLLSIAASVALRRNGHSIKSLIAQFAGPAVFAVYLLVFYTLSV